MPLNIYKLHSDPTKLKWYGNKILLAYNTLYELMEDDQPFDDTFLNGISEDKLKDFIENCSIPIKQLEKILSKHENLAYSYAVNILKGRFKLGENAISKNAEFSYLYAVNILKGRFKLAEDNMKEHEEVWAFYKEDVLNA